MSPDWRFNIAYNACLQAANAALYAAGYRPTKAGGNQHYRSLQSLALTIGASKGDVAQLELFRKKRNVTEYEQSGTIADADIEAVRSLAQKLSKAVRSWIEKHHPSLVRKG